MMKLTFPFKITFIYILLGSAWILFSDNLVYYFIQKPDQIHQISTYKGWFYVLITGLLLFVLIRNELKRKNAIYLQLLEAKKKAEESDRLKTKFLANISHYIRTPMNGILGFVELLEDKDTSPESHALFLKYINEQSHYLLQTINSIIEISQIQEGQVVVSETQFSLNKMLDSIINSDEVSILKNENVIVETHYSLSNNEDIIFADREKVFRILFHLISNAFKFTSLGKVSVGYLIQENQVVFSIIDTGIGISDERKELIFTELLYSNPLKIRKNEGVGLGLPLSAGLTKLIGGQLWIESTGNTGSTFCFSIPYNKIEMPALKNN